MEDRAVKIISIVFHPIFMPLYIILLVITFPFYVASQLPVTSKLILFGIVAVMTVLIPVIFTAFMQKRKVIRTFYMETKEERIYPLLTVAIAYYITYYILKGYPVSELFSYYMLGSTFLAVVALIISFYSKISLHMIGIGATLGLVLGMALNFSFDLFWPLAALILVSGILGYARLKTNSHKPSEVYTGFLMGGAVMFVLFYFI